MKTLIIMLIAGISLCAQSAIDFTDSEFWTLLQNCRSKTVQDSLIMRRYGAVDTGLDTSFQDINGFYRYEIGANIVLVLKQRHNYRDKILCVLHFDGGEKYKTYFPVGDDWKQAIDDELVDVANQTIINILNNFKNKVELMEL